MSVQVTIHSTITNHLSTRPSEKCGESHSSSVLTDLVELLHRLLGHELAHRDAVSGELIGGTASQRVLVLRLEGKVFLDRHDRGRTQ